MSEKYEPFSHWTIPASSVQKLKGLLEQAGPEAHLEIHLIANAQVYLKVVPTQGVKLDDEGGVNESHICPPACP